MHNLHAALLLTIGLLPCHLTAQSSVRWTPSFDDALATAKAERKVVVLAFNMAGERANEEMVGEHYKHPVLARLSSNTVNVFCSTATVARVPGVSVAQQQAAELKARAAVLKIGPGEDVIAPQHVFLDPDGAVLSSIAYRVTVGELEWAWVDAIKKVHPEFVWQPSAGARAPVRLAFGSVESGKNENPPTSAEVDAALKTIKKSRGGLLRQRESVELVLRSAEPDAIGFVEATLNTLEGRTLVSAIDTIGLQSPRAYHTVVAPYLSHRDEDVRYAAAGAIDRLAEPKALPATMKQWRLEKADRVRGRLLRALASTGPASKDVIAVIEKVMAKEPAADVRAHAVLAAALLEDRAAAQAILLQALTDGSAKVRSTVGFALASRRETDLLPRLEQAVKQEEDVDTKAWLEAAVEVVRGGTAGAFRNFLESVLGETKPRAGLSLDGFGGGGRRG